ncbi:uncharacterized protein LOC143295509 [Babylonia areolata]|uniref:uncharacterized protein LOC143295509 n=1 Tax=Babylonia areolata TaxID=304850 RepID=UPI003FD32913
MASQTQPAESTSAEVAVASRRSARQSLRTKKYKFDPSDFKIKPKASKAGSSSSSAPAEGGGGGAEGNGGGSKPVPGEKGEKAAPSNGPSKAVTAGALSSAGGAKTVTGGVRAGRPKRTFDLHSMKPRKRTNKRAKSVAAQIEQTKDGTIDLSPNSFLGKINLKNLLNNKTFGMLPAEYQYKLIKLLPQCDQLLLSDNGLRISPTALNNEFFAKACQEWKDRLVEGEFTPENQQRLKAEEEKEQKELDPWKAKHFEPVWGQRVLSDVPKATDPSQVKTADVSPAPTPPTAIKVKVKPPSCRNSMMLTMPKPKAAVAAQALSTDAGPHLPAVTQKPLSTAAAASITSQVGLLATLSQPAGQRTITTTTTTSSTSAVSHPPTGIVIYRTPDGNMRSRSTDSRADLSTSPSPPKKARVAPVQPRSQTQAAARTLAQIRAQTQAARQQNRGMPLGCSQASVVSASQPGVTLSGGVSVMTGHHVGLAQPNFVIKQQGQTRTLAQIKAQTQAARAQSGSSSPSPSLSAPAMRSLLSNTSTPAPSATLKTHNPVTSQKVKGQTRTLASIKADTQARGQGSAVQTSALDSPKHQPAIVRSRVVPRVSNSGNSEKLETGSVNLTRSQQICQAELEKSLAGRMTPGSTVELSGAAASTAATTAACQPSQVTASKLLFSQSPRATPSPVAVEAVGSSKSGEVAQHTFIHPVSPALNLTRSGTPTKIITVSRGPSPGLTKILSVPASPNPVSNPGTAGLEATTTNKIYLVNAATPITPAAQGGQKVVLMNSLTMVTPNSVLTSQPVTLSTNSGGVLTFPTNSAGVLTLPTSSGTSVLTIPACSASVLTIPACSTGLLTIPTSKGVSTVRNSSQGTTSYLTHEALCALLNSSIPPRAASAPPNNVLSDNNATNPAEPGAGLVRSASVGGGSVHTSGSPSLQNMQLVVNKSLAKPLNGSSVGKTVTAAVCAVSQGESGVTESASSSTPHSSSSPVTVTTGDGSSTAPSTSSPVSITVTNPSPSDSQSLSVVTLSSLQSVVPVSSSTSPSTVNTPSVSSPTLVSIPSSSSQSCTTSAPLPISQTVSGTSPSSSQSTVTVPSSSSASQSLNNQEESSHFLSKAGTATQVGCSADTSQVSVTLGTPTVVVMSALSSDTAAVMTVPAGGNPGNPSPLQSAPSPKVSQTGVVAPMGAQAVGSSPLVGVVGHQGGGSAAANPLSTLQSLNVALNSNRRNRPLAATTKLTGLLSVAATVAVTPVANALPGIHVLANSGAEHATVVLPQAGHNGGVMGTGTLGGGEIGQSCMCNHKAMVMCKQCGAFSHDVCTGPSKLCVNCLYGTVN